VQAGTTLLRLTFTYCPIASRFIDTLDDARAYYYFRLVAPGTHRIYVGRVAVDVRFNAEETHIFSSARPIPDAQQITRPGKAREVRYFDRNRARQLDQILRTLEKPARALAAKDARGVSVYGPPKDGAQRMCVIVGPDRSAWYVRTAYPVSADDFRRVLQSKAAKWPP